jgi:hypothetical protein
LVAGGKRWITLVDAPMFQRLIFLSPPAEGVDTGFFLNTTLLEYLVFHKTNIRTHILLPIFVTSRRSR